MSTRILLVSGSTRAGSTNTAFLRAARVVAPDGVTTALYERLADLPAFNPDDDHDPLPSPIAELRAQIAEADGVLFCTPEYAGAMPGSFKNLLDWTVGGEEMYRKPVAWVNVAPEGRGLHADASLATVLGYLHAGILKSAGTRLVVPRDAVGSAGEVRDPRLRAQIAGLLQTFLDEIRESAGP